MSKFKKPKPKKTIAFRIGDEFHKNLEEEIKLGKKDKSRFFEGLMWLGWTAYKRTKNIS